MKTYGGELVERLGQRTAEVSTAMHEYVEGFDSKVSSKSTEVTASLDQRLQRFQEALDSRTQTLNDALSSRVMDIAKTLAEGGKEVVTALDKRISDVTGVMNTRGSQARRDDRRQDRRNRQGARLPRRARSPTRLDNRIGRFEQLLVGRAEHVTEQIEVRTKAAADALNARMEQLCEHDQDQRDRGHRSLSLAGSRGLAGRVRATPRRRGRFKASGEVHQRSAPPAPR